MKHSQGRLNRMLRRMMTAVGLILTLLLSIKGICQTGENVNWGEAGEWLAQRAGAGLSSVWKRQYPATVWYGKEEYASDSEKGRGFEEIFKEVIFRQSPLYRYFGKRQTEKAEYGEQDPAFLGYLESGRFYEEHSFLLYDGGEESREDGNQNPGGQMPSEASGEDVKTQSRPMPEEIQVKDETMTCAASTVWPVTGTTYRKEQLADYDFLIKHFYSIHASTTAGRELMKADEFLAEDFTLKGSADSPQILIYHTHSQETFADYGAENPEATVVGIGNYLTELLTEKGYHVIHDTSVYDLKGGRLDRNKAYTYALDGISGILQENPSIEVVLDIHRDGVNEKLHMVNQVNGKPTAPIMFFNGVSQTPEGPIEYLPNPYREKNLAFSFQMQLDAEAYFPGLTRKIYIKGLRYNQHLRPRSALVEVGAQTNTYQEALNAMEPLAEVLHMVLQGN